MSGSAACIGTVGTAPGVGYGRADGPAPGSSVQRRRIRRGYHPARVEPDRAGPRTACLLGQLDAHWSAFPAYPISFATIGIVWVNHHALFRTISAVDRTLLFLNLLLLLFVVLIPFATATEADYFPHNSPGRAARDDAVRRGVPRHVGRLRLDLRVDAARPARTCRCRRRSAGQRGRDSSAAGWSTWSRSSSPCSTPLPRSC